MSTIYCSKNHNLLIHTTILFCSVIFIFRINADHLINNLYEYKESRTPFAARQDGMAGAGYSLPDDENVLFFNPAGLGMQNERFNKFSFVYGNIGYFAAKSKYLLQGHYTALCIQPFKQYDAGFGLHIESVIANAKNSAKEIVVDDQTGMPIETGRRILDKRSVSRLIIGYGNSFGWTNHSRHSLGISLKPRLLTKHYFDTLAREISLSADIGYIATFANRKFLIGYLLSEIPFANEAENLFNMNISLGFSPIFRKSEEKRLITGFIEVSGSLPVPVVKFPDGLISRIGLELCYFNKVFCRWGFLMEKYSLGITTGLGLRIFNRCDINFFYGLQKNNTEYYCGKSHQFGLSFSFFSS